MEIQEEIKRAIVERFNNLQPEIQAVIMDSKYETTLYEIGKKQNLNTEKMSNLELNTTLVLLGQTHPDEYKNELVKDIDLPEEKIIEIVNDVNEKILKPVRGLLKKNFEDEKEITPEAKPVNLPVLDSRFSGLPKEVQTAVARSNWRETLYSLAPKYKLTIEQMGFLEEITVKVMLNTIHSNSYENELASKITIPKEDVSNLVKEINENIFKKIRIFEESSKEQVVSSRVGGGLAQINNEELIIKNENTKEKPIVDYKLPIKNETLEDEIPLPPYRIIKNEELIINNGGGNTNTAQNNVQDILKKIEPVKPIGSTSQVIKQQTQQPELSQNTPVPQQPTPSVRSIIEEKLMGSTVSDSTTTDYSNPKTHDPYREAF